MIGERGEVGSGEGGFKRGGDKEGEKTRTGLEDNRARGDDLPSITQKPVEHVWAQPLDEYNVCVGRNVQESGYLVTMSVGLVVLEVEDERVLLGELVGEVVTVLKDEAEQPLAAEAVVAALGVCECETK